MPMPSEHAFFSLLESDGCRVPLAASPCASAMPPKQAAKQKSCKPCRERHLKCNRAAPVCSACQKSRYWKNCIYDEPKKLRFRNLLVAPSRVESEEDEGDSAQQPSPPGMSAAAGVLRNARSPSSPSDATSTAHDNPPEARVIRQATRMSTSTPISPATHFTEGLVQDSPVATQESPATIRSTGPPRLSNSVSLEYPPNTISDDTEAYIFSFYLETAGPWVSLSYCQGPCEDVRKLSVEL
jgi:hypothetical protein